ncbi:hypothetical protein B0H15DRAFT_904062 [Mycena belliarum]|uniref:F-box domain-containing protein n=1 Tax=Mycena belliarum TaxID=1033014 RepID=A0AAD6U8T2_9AGAR|nr:hypothetical protein B0H15DRAFT_904062 [Mycena belliae]
MSRLPEIPPELLQVICLCLDALSIVRLSQVSRQFHRLLQDSSALQYNIQLELAGLCDGQAVAASAARLELLKVYQAAWASFEWTQSNSTRVESEGNLWELVGNVLAMYRPERGFSFTRIPSPIRNVPSAQWSVPDVPISVKDFSMDLSQDLLLVVEFDEEKSATVVHLLSLQTGQAHPSARNPLLARLIQMNMPGPSSFQIRIFGEYIGVMAEDFDDDVELLIWNWKSATLKKHMRRADITSFAFLDSQRLLIAGLTTDLQPELRVLDIKGHISDMTGYVSFRLPALSRPLQDVTEIDMRIQTEPAPSWPAGCNMDEPFAVSHTDRLFVVSLRRWEAFQATEPTFMLCFLLSTLRDMMERSHDGGENRTVFTWGHWGPHGTRMLRVAQLPDPWVCFVYGQRCLLQTDRTRCKILDFNPLSPSPDRMIDERTVDKRRRLFLHPVTTSAPFTLTSVDIAPSAAVMLAEDAIVAVSTDEDAFTIFSV